MSSKNPVHINIYKENEANILSSNNKTETYIILSNEELNNKNRDLIQEIENLKAEKDILEEDNEKMEKSLTYQRGLLHNLSSLNKYEETISKKEREINENYSEEVEFMVEQIRIKENNIMIYSTILCILLLIVSLVGFIDFTSSISILITPIIVFVGGNFYKQPIRFNFNSLEKFKNKNKSINETIKINKIKIDKIKNSSDFLEDYIDSI